MEFSKISSDVFLETDFLLQDIYEKFQYERKQKSTYQELDRTELIVCITIAAMTLLKI